MPLLYALPITLAVVGTIAVTLLVVEVIVPALIVQDPHHHNHRGRRGRRRKVLVGASSRQEDRGQGSISTGVAARSGDYGYEIRKRRPAANRQQQQEQQQRQEDEELHVLGEVTASEYELAAGDNSLPTLAMMPPPALPSSPPARPSYTSATREETEEQRPLLHFAEEELAAGGDHEKLDPSLLEQDGTIAVAASSTATVHQVPSSEAAPKPVVDGPAKPILEAATSSSYRDEDSLSLGDFARGQIAPNSNPDSGAASSSSLVVLASLGGPPAAPDRHREQSTSVSTAPPPPAQGAEITNRSDTIDSVDRLHAADATAAADWAHHPLASPLSSSTAGAAAATITRSAIPYSSDSTRATSSALITAAADAPSLSESETGIETGFSSPELLSMSRSTSQSDSISGAGEAAARSGTGEEEEEEDASSSWTRVSSPCGFTSLSSDDDDVEDISVRAAQLQ